MKIVDFHQCAFEGYVVEEVRNETDAVRVVVRRDARRRLCSPSCGGTMGENRVTRNEVRDLPCFGKPTLFDLNHPKRMEPVKKLEINWDEFDKLHEGKVIVEAFKRPQEFTETGDGAGNFGPIADPVKFDETGIRK